jgi:quercetin dioxygenase-like cupin family protein
MWHHTSDISQEVFRMTERWLIDPYLDWAAGEGIPVIAGLHADLDTIETRPWARTDANGALVHLDARGDFLDVQVTDLLPGRSTSPQRHLFEEAVYVVSGKGSTSVEGPGGSKHSFEWQKGSMFALPLNGRYRHFNGSGSQPARLASVTSMPAVMNLFHSEALIYDCDLEFPERWGDESHFKGDGTFVEVREHRHQWQTNFVPSLLKFDRLQPAPSRGLGATSIMFVLADSVMHAHMSEIKVGTYKKGHRHPIDFHIIQLNGSGYSLYWYPEDKDYTRIDWKHGLLHAPPDQMFHQHFNTSGEPARYLAIAFGGVRYPFTEAKRRMWMGDPRDNHKTTGGRAQQIPYEEQDPRIHELYKKELAANGVKLEMPEELR